LFCDGGETCESTNGCVDATDEDDGTPCDEGTIADGNVCNSSCLSGTCVVADAVCDDGLICNGTETCHTTDGCLPGTAAAAGTACDEGAGENGNPCDSSCQSGACVDTANASSGQPCEDAYECTVNYCDGSGACVVTNDDEYCDAINAGDLCRPDCFGGATGCGTPPGFMTLVCDPLTVDLQTTDTSTCNLGLDGVDGQVDCLSCVATMGGLVEVDYSSFDACDANGWTLVTDPTGCVDLFSSCNPGTVDQPCCDDWATICVTVGPDSFLRTNKGSNCGGGVEEWRIQKNYTNFSDLIGLEMCFDIAGHNANIDQAIAVVADGPDNPGVPDMFFCDSGGPRDTVDDIFYRFCAPLPAWANGSSDVTLTIIAHSEDNQRTLLLDNISIRGWNDVCTPNYLTAFTEDFAGCPDPLTDGWGGWHVSGTVNCTTEAFTCYDTSERLWVDGTDAELWTSVDTTGLVGDVWLCFYFGDDGNNNNSRWLDLGMKTDPTALEWTEVWSFLGDQEPDQSCQEVCVNLTDVDPNAANNDDLRLRFYMYSGRDPLYLDQITLRGAEICDAAGAVDLSAIIDNLDGTYTFTAQDTAGIAIDVDITCTWDDPPAGEVAATRNLTFQ
jgi:hypothetical protein